MQNETIGRENGATEQGYGTAGQHNGEAKQEHGTAGQENGATKQEHGTDGQEGDEYMLKAELKSHILNLRFWAGVLLILAAALVSEQTHLQFLLDSGGSREGPGWFLAYSF
ncbi:hypothetical protein [Schaedlerella arabinosiphila]|uniref:hypothetical protein n=1 Tax=Schaedlerella arabinosiphila TaxID=2044587 RepID=UPI002150E986|nr:hypothetical protein [Schaedlerella arabinosiphila]